MAPGKPWRSICVPQAARLRGFAGMDELYLIIKAFVPGASFPELRPHGIDGCEQVARQYYSYPVFNSEVSILKRSGVWSRS